MIKNFDEFLNEQRFEPMDSIDANIVAIDKDTEEEYSIEIVELDKQGKLLPDHNWAASVYVMTDDTVEIRSIEKTHIHAIISGLSGEDVRQGDLHRHEWFIYNK